MDYNKLYNILKCIRIRDYLIFWETCIQVKKQQVEPGMEQYSGSKPVKKYMQTVYHHLASLTYMQSTSCEMQGWWLTNWKQDSWEKYQQPQICRRWQKSRDEQNNILMRLKMNLKKKLAFPGLHSHQQCKSSLFSTPSPAFVACRLFDSSHSDWCVMVPHWGFDLQFSDNEWCWACFHVFVSHLYVFFGEMFV